MLLERERKRGGGELNVNPTYSRNILFLREPFVFFVLVTRDTYPWESFSDSYL